MEYVTLETAKRQLGVDHDADDPIIQIYIEAASGAVKNYLKSSLPFDVERDEFGAVVLDEDGKPYYRTDNMGRYIIRPEVISATLILIGHFYKDRDNNAEGAFEQGYLPKPVTALLYPLRDPALA